MSEITIMMGVPKVGITTYVEWELEEEQIVIKSINYNELETFLSEGKNIIIDCHNMYKERRHNIIELAKRYNYDVIGKFIRVSKETCVKRLEQQGNSFLKEVVEEGYDKFEVPSIEEGFDSLIIIDGE